MENPPTNITRSRGFLSKRLRLLIAVIAVIGLAAFAVLLFVGLGGYTWRSEVSVVQAELRSPDRLALIVDSCHKDPEVSILRETNVDVQVKVVADSHPFLRGGIECLDIVEVRLQEPLGDRGVVDKHTGRSVSVTTVSS